MCRIQISFGHAETTTISVFIRWFINYSKQNVKKKYMYTVERRYMELGYFKFPVFLNVRSFPLGYTFSVIYCQLSRVPAISNYFPVSLNLVKSSRQKVHHCVCKKGKSYRPHEICNVYIWLFKITRYSFF